MKHLRLVTCHPFTPCEAWPDFDSPRYRTVTRQTDPPPAPGTPQPGSGPRRGSGGTAPESGSHRAANRTGIRTRIGGQDTPPNQERIASLKQQGPRLTSGAAPLPPQQRTAAKEKILGFLVLGLNRFYFLVLPVPVIDHLGLAEIGQFNPSRPQLYGRRIVLCLYRVGLGNL